MLIVFEALKLLSEIALLALAGQWVLGLLAGAKREENLVYKLFQVITSPLVRSARWIAPKVILDQHLPLVAFLLLSFVWVLATAGKINHCIQIGVHLCQ